MPVQNHIHMAAALGSGPENAPVQKWVVHSRVPTPRITMSLKEDIEGRQYVHTPTDGNGKRIKRLDFVYQIFARDVQGDLSALERLDLLLELYGERVYLVDNIHPNDGEDHTPAVRNMIVVKVSDYSAFSVAATDYLVTVHLADDQVQS